MIGSISRGHHPASILPLHRLHGRIGLQHARGKPCQQSLRQLLHTSFERGKNRAARWRSFHVRASRQHPSPQAAILRLHLGKPRQHRANTELRGLAAVDAGEQRVRQAIDHLRTVVALDQGGNTFVALRPARRKTPFPYHAKFCGRGKKRRQQRRRQFGGNHEHQPIGHGHEPALHQDVGSAIAVIGTDELIFQADPAAEVRGPGLFREKRIRTSLHQAAIHLLPCAARRRSAGLLRKLQTPAARLRGGALQARKPPPAQRCRRRQSRSVSYVLESCGWHFRPLVRPSEPRLYHLEPGCAEYSCTNFASAFTFSTGVSGRMPCPRLKICPGVRRRAAESLPHPP